MSSTRAFLHGLLGLFTLVSLAHSAPPASKTEHLDKAAWHGAIPMTKETNGVLLEAKSGETPRLETTEEFTPPFKVTAKIIPDATNTRIYYGKGQFILNWENEPDQVRYHDFTTGAPTPVPSKALKAGKEYTVVIDVDPKHLTLTISGKRIYSGTGDFTALKSNLGIGPALGSKIHVLSLVVEK